MRAMTGYLQNALRARLQRLRRLRARLVLARLDDRGVLQVGAIRDALSDVLSGVVAPDETRLFDAIESRRSELLGNKDRIPVIDYGAGMPGESRHAEEMLAGVRSTAAIAELAAVSKPAFWARTLFKVVRKLQPSSCVELGACVGISASYQAAALSLNRRGRLTTLEGSPAIADIAATTLKGLGLCNAKVVTGPFHETLEGTLVEAAPIDYFFNDAHHDHDAVIRYFEQALPHLSREGAVVVFDDIRWSDGMFRAWRAIERDERVAASFDLLDMGLVLVAQNAGPRRKYTLPLKAE